MAPRGNKNALGNKGVGRPSEFRPAFLPMARKLAQLGGLDEDFAEAFWGECTDDLPMETPVC
jgi:hypothetical protein